MFLKTCNASRCAVTATVVLTKMISPRTAYQKLRQNYSHSEPVFPTRIPSTRPATVDRMISSTNRFPIPPHPPGKSDRGSGEIQEHLFFPAASPFQKAGRRLKKRHQSMHQPRVGRRPCQPVSTVMYSYRPGPRNWEGTR